jgi:hypothetical protein
MLLTLMILALNTIIIAREEMNRIISGPAQEMLVHVIDDFYHGEREDYSVPSTGRERKDH